MASTYEPIATTTLSSDQSSVTFSSISGSYTDLILVSNSSITSSVGYISLQYNSDTGSNYSRTELYGSGTAAGSLRGTNETSVVVGLATPSTNKPAVSITHIMNYANSTTYKTTISRGGNTADFTEAYAGLWRSTSAITSIKIIGGTFVTGSMFTLYGIKAA